MLARAKTGAKPARPRSLGKTFCTAAQTSSIGSCRAPALASNQPLDLYSVWPLQCEKQCRAVSPGHPGAWVFAGSPLELCNFYPRRRRWRRQVSVLVASGWAASRSSIGALGRSMGARSLKTGSMNKETEGRHANAAVRTFNSLHSCACTRRAGARNAGESPQPATDVPIHAPRT